MPNYRIVTSGGVTDIVGADDYMSAGDADLNQLLASSGYQNIVGADAMNPLEQQILSRSAVMTQQTEPTKAREYPIGFVSAAPVAAGATVDIVAQPQIVFRGERLIVPSDIAGGFTIDDLKVGKNSQFASSGPVPARTFDEQGVGVRLRLDTAQISQQIVISVTNIGGAPATFRATLIGTAVE